MYKLSESDQYRTDFLFKASWNSNSPPDRLLTSVIVASLMRFIAIYACTRFVSLVPSCVHGFFTSPPTVSFPLLLNLPLSLWFGLPSYHLPASLLSQLDHLTDWTPLNFWPYSATLGLVMEAKGFHQYFIFPKLQMLIDFEGRKTSENVRLQISLCKKKNGLKVGQQTLLPFLNIPPIAPR